MSEWRSGWTGVDVRGIAEEDLEATLAALQEWTRAADFSLEDLDVRAVGEINGTSVDWTRRQDVGPWVDEAQRLLERALRELGHTLVDDFRRVKIGEAVYARAAFAESSDAAGDPRADFSQAVRFLLPEGPMSTDIAWQKVRSARTLDQHDLETAVRLGEVHPESLQRRFESSTRVGLAPSTDVLTRIERLLALVPPPRAEGSFDTAEASFASLAQGYLPEAALTAQSSQLFQLTTLAAQSPSPDSRRAVSRVVPHLEVEHQLLLLRAISQSSDPWLRRWTLDAVPSIGAEAIDLIRDLAGDEDPCVAVPFLDLLLALHDRHSMHAAKRLLKHDHPAVRARAALLVGLVASRALAADLRRAAAVEEHPDVRDALTLAMAWLSGETPRPPIDEAAYANHLRIEDPSFGADDRAAWLQAPTVRHSMSV